MGLPEILLIVGCAAIVAGVVIAWAVRKSKGKSSGCSGCCGNCSSCSSCASKKDTPQPTNEN